MPTEAKRAGERIGRAMQSALLHAWTGLPWALLFWLGGVIAVRRWSGLPLALSLSASAGAAMQGWRLVWRIAAKLDDVLIARWLLQVEDSPAWAIFPQQERVIKAAHLSHCQRRWGVNARSSGWERFCLSWRRDAVLSLGCAALAVHAWWLGI